MHHDRFENALMHYDILLKKEPDQIEYLYNSGVAQMALGHLNEAIILFDHILDLENTHAFSLNNLAAIYLKMEQKEKAQKYLERALVINPKDCVSSHMLHAITGERNANTTPEYTQNLFNNYALYYDQHMKTTLHYSIPQAIARIIHQLHLPAHTSTLDLGCGTGLTGIVLRDISQHLIGVDIAAKMLAQAKEKHIYDQLKEVEINQFLQHNKQTYDLIVAADVLTYLGELDALFDEIREHLNPKGYFIFTTEISTTTDWFLETSARFSHHPDYIKKLAKQKLDDRFNQANEILAKIENLKQGK
jgi:predicted TPR repeat methyltransferase